MKREDLYIRSFRGEDGFNEFVEALGGDPVAITKTAGLASNVPNGPINFEPFAKFCTLFEEAAARTNEPYFGLKWALSQPEDNRLSGPTVLLMSMARNTRHWVDMTIDYQKIHTNGVSYNYVEDEDTQSVTGFVYVHPLAPPCRQFFEQIMAAIAIIGHRFVPDFKLDLITFQHSAPENMELYEKIFQCPIIFDADQNTIVADLKYMNVKKTSLLTKMTTPVVKQYLDWQLVKNPKTKQSISMLIAESLPSILGVNGSDIIHVSQALDIHPKKLQRLLKDEGTTYSNILGTVRKSIASRLLTESNISISRLARMLDYSSDRAFTTAAKRWFNMPPTEYRRSR